MNGISNEELNNAAMQIILHAGDCRNLLSEAITKIEGDASYEEACNMIKLAKKEITKAHQIQTEMIQSTIENDELQTTLLFTHAQDTLMTINSEVIMTNHLIHLYYKMNEKVNAL